jgi:hypothetical protein
MKVVTRNSIVGVIRARRGYKTFLSKFINECEIVDAIPIPEGATNGEMMKIMFPDLKVEIEGKYITCWIDEHRWFAPDYDWWNAPYKGVEE